MKDALESPEESPDIFAPPKKGPGGKRLNELAAAIFFGAVVVVVLVMMYGWDKSSTAEAQANAELAEKAKQTGPSVAPIKRPEGPDVDPVQIIAQSMPVEVQPVAPAMSEAEVKAQEKRLAEYEAAMKASPRVQGSAMSQKPQQMQQGVPVMQPPGTAGLVPPPPPMAGDEDQGDINQHAQKQAFLNARDDDSSPYLKHTRTAPPSDLVLTAGSVIPVTLITTVSSRVPGGLVKGQVRKNVYDSVTRQHVLIPAGAVVHGVNDATIAAGQEAIMAAWQIVTFPDGSTLTLDRMPAVDKSGAAGMQDQVDNHYLRLFGQAALVSLITAGGQLSQPRGSAFGGYSASQILAAQVGIQGSNVASQVIRRNLGIQSTLTARSGLEVNIAVMKPIIFLTGWKGHPAAMRAAVEE